MIIIKGKLWATFCTQYCTSWNCYICWVPDVTVIGVQYLDCLLMYFMCVLYKKHYFTILDYQALNIWFGCPNLTLVLRYFQWQLQNWAIWSRKCFDRAPCCSGISCCQQSWWGSWWGKQWHRKMLSFEGEANSMLTVNER